MTLIILIASGCNSDQVKLDDLENMKARNEALTNYSCSFQRQVGGDIVKGKLYYKEGNIRFEVFGKNDEIQTVEIVNLTDNYTYLYDPVQKIGESQNHALFSQDVPLPQEVMQNLTGDNTQIEGQEQIDHITCSLFRVSGMQLPGSKFSGKIWILADKGFPMALEGNRKGNDKLFRYEYRNLDVNAVSDSLLEPPADINFVPAP